MEDTLKALQSKLKENGLWKQHFLDKPVSIESDRYDPQDWSGPSLNHQTDATWHQDGDFHLVPNFQQASHHGFMPAWLTRRNFSATPIYGFGYGPRRGLTNLEGNLELSLGDPTKGVDTPKALLPRTDSHSTALAFINNEIIWHRGNESFNQHSHPGAWREFSRIPLRYTN